ncbi:hypothetical protein L0Y65_01345 [Candidatus Micrarchaeota archaeon]|nr:hypothetical protein [Candidatus Micrarchaeota archaeon]
MKTLAARSLISDKAGKIAKAAAIAAPMVLVECGGMPKNDAHPSPVPVVVEVPAATGSANAGEAPPWERGKMPPPAKQADTVLNAGIYPGCVIEARLSVIRPDDTLERVILDPKADFYYSKGGYQTAKGKLVGLCAKTAECDISEFVRTNIAHQLMSLGGHQNEAGAYFRITYDPEAGSRLAPAQTTLRVRLDEFVSYCR